jgi:acetyltransferase
MKKQLLQSLFNPRSIAIVGASNKHGKVGTVLTENILKLGYKGKVYLVNPSYKLLKLKKCYSSLSAIGKEVDLAIIAVPAKFVPDVIKENASKIKNFVVISAGFTETGIEGHKREEELAKLAKKHKLNILGPNCLGFIMPGLKLNASFAGGMPKAGNIAFVSQSGALAVALMDKANEENLGFSSVVSVGNKMQIDESLLLEYFANDRNTKVIGMYLEGVKNGKLFLETAQRISRIKPIVILKAGKTEKSQKAISSHTGALAGSDEIIDVAFEKAGVIRAKDLQQFFDLLSLISFTDTPKNEKAIIITNAGGAGVLTTDAFKGRKISLCDLEEKIKRELKSHLPEEASVENPIDLLGDAQEDRYGFALNILRSKKIGSTISILTPQQQTPVEKIADQVIKNKYLNNSTNVTVFIGGHKVNHAIARLKHNQIPNFANPDSAIEALDKYWNWTQFKKTKNGIIKQVQNASRKKEVLKLIADAKTDGKKALLFDQAAHVMGKYGISAGEYYSVKPKATAPTLEKFPLVAKIDSDKVLHKSDKQGLVLGIKNQNELESAVKLLQANFPGEQLVIQPMQDKQIELILGIKKDQTFGPVIVFGLGGIYTEVFKMVNFLVPPMSLEQIKQQVLDSKLGFLFTGVRGQKPYDLEEFAKILHGLMAFAVENIEISEFDVNPLFIYNDGRPASAVDIKIIF